MAQTSPSPPRRVLNAGSGPQSPRQLHPVFAQPEWHEVRMDIDPEAKPDVLGSVTDMTGVFTPESFDAVWSSHVLEHLYGHQVPEALREFRRVLKPDGFALITSPDIEAVAAMIVERGLGELAYTAPAGPITPLDMLYGHSASLARGKLYMAHNTGFTCDTLGQQLVEAGFATVLAKRDRFDLWAVALMPRADKSALQGQLRAAGLDMTEFAD